MVTRTYKQMNATNDAVKLTTAAAGAGTTIILHFSWSDAATIFAGITTGIYSIICIYEWYKKKTLHKHRK